MKRSVFFAALASAVVLLWVACGDDANPSEPSTTLLTASLVSPNSDDGAIVFRVAARQPATVDAVEAACDCEVFLHRVSDREVRGVLVGEPRAGYPTLRATVSGASSVDYFSFRVDQAASRSGEFRTYVSEYGFSVR